METAGQDAQAPAEKQSAFDVGNTEWGYVIAAKSRTPRLVVIWQAVTYFIGLAAAIVAVALWFLPGASMSDDVLSMKIAVSVVFGAAAILCFWFASRAVKSELQVDLVKRELREALCARSGARKIVGRIPFDQIDAVFLSRATETRATAKLQMRFKKGGNVVDMATGPEAQLAVLKNRLVYDLRTTTAPARRQTAEVKPQPKTAASALRQGAA